VRSVAWVLAAALALGCARVAARAETFHAADMRRNLFSACFVTDRQGWTVGDLGRIFHTTDGARTWQQQDAGTKRAFVAVSCVDSRTLWVAGQSGQIAHSADGGNTWRMQHSGTQRQLLDIAFANARRGLAVGDFGTILRTDDGGATWTKLPFPKSMKLPADVADIVDPGDVLLYAVAFVDAEHVWMAGEFGTVLASADGGLTWQQQHTPVESTLFDIAFSDLQHGWAVGLDTTLLHTTDGGLTWTKQEAEKPKGFSPALYGVEVRGTYGWAVGDNGFLLNSVDAGASWHMVKVPVQMGSSWFSGLALRPDGRGFIVGASGLVLAADRDSFTPLKKRF
jgi:photosystem II stability/assembly factor-like uncharacterized protein